MERKTLEQEIADLLETIGEEMGIIGANTGVIPQIEIDLVMANIRRLYQAMIDLNKANGLPVNQEVMVTEDERKPFILDFSPRPAAMPEPGLKTGPELPEESPEPVIAVTHTDELPHRTEEPVRKPEAARPVQPDLFSKGTPITLADKLRSENGSLYDKLEKEAARDILADKIQHRIGDLKATIGISEKFQMLNELFGGDMKAYDETIDHLNGLGTFGQAAEYLEETGTRFGIDPNSPAFRMMLQILKKRYL